ncbi:hypothetical protein ABZS81_30745 [Streptomyces sp. NPDC005318]|uniref:hypothetical protein n=1 Tax=Streptomyces sp. NPDC005318 TaxID=3157031 RepID=UPI0033A82E40
MPTMIGSFFTSFEGSNCQATTPAMTKTAKIARIRSRIDRIAVLSLTSPTWADVLRNAHHSMLRLTQSHDFHIWKSKSLPFDLSFDS